MALNRGARFIVRRNPIGMIWHLVRILLSTGVRCINRLLVLPVWLALFGKRFGTFDIVLAFHILLLRRINCAHCLFQLGSSMPR